MSFNMDTFMRQLNFPRHFRWGVATSAYQIEGGAEADGKKPSIWDAFCRMPGVILDGKSGVNATNHYFLWKQDIQLMKELGIKTYRFSIAWSRIFPDGVGEVNPKGVAFYDALIDALLNAGIEPMITLYHWDLPQILQEKGGWISRDTVSAFAQYAQFCFLKYRDRVHLWITHNEPWVAAKLGHEWGVHAPGLRSNEAAVIAAHHLLLSHGMALQSMRPLATQSQKLGIALNLNPVCPENPSREADIQAAHKYELFLNDFFLKGLFKGVYPTEILAEFPALSRAIHPQDMDLIHTPIDFIGINYYTRTLVNTGGVVAPQGNPHSSMWEFYPQGLREIVERVWNDYHPKEIFITENGTALESESLVDLKRIEYIQAHLIEIHKLLANSICVSGYYAWSFLDNFEWAHGYEKRFGLVHVDFGTYQRIPRSSALWYKQVINNNSVEI